MEQEKNRNIFGRFSSNRSAKFCRFQHFQCFCSCLLWVSMVTDQDFYVCYGLKCYFSEKFMKIRFIWYINQACPILRSKVMTNFKRDTRQNRHRFKITLECQLKRNKAFSAAPGNWPTQYNWIVPLAKSKFGIRPFIWNLIINRTLCDNVCRSIATCCHAHGHWLNIDVPLCFLTFP